MLKDFIIHIEVKDLSSQSEVRIKAENQRHAIDLYIDKFLPYHLIYEIREIEAIEESPSSS